MVNLRFPLVGSAFHNDSNAEEKCNRGNYLLRLPGHTDEAPGLSHRRMTFLAMVIDLQQGAAAGRINS